MKRSDVGFRSTISTRRPVPSYVNSERLVPPSLTAVKRSTASHSNVFVYVAVVTLVRFPFKSCDQKASSYRCYLSLFSNW